MSELPRLVYLITRYKVKIPPAISKLIPGGEWLSKLSNGLGASVSSAGAPLGHLAQLYKEGEQLGSGSPEEARSLILELLVGELDRAPRPLEDKLRIYSIADRFLRGEDLLAEEEVDLASITAPPLIPKWDSGFAPLDLVTGGLYQGLLVLMGRPGTGKTSLLLSLTESLSRQGIPVLFVQNEIPKQMMLSRIGPLAKRTPLKGTLICASWGAEEIEEYITEHPDPERVVIYDSPDVVVSESAEARRFTLEHAYQVLVRVKQKSKLVAVSSQPRRKDEHLQLTSLAESWAKAWYADMIVGIQQTGGVIKLRMLKNRFGPSGSAVSFNYDYETLEYSGAKGVEEW